MNRGKSVLKNIFLSIEITPTIIFFAYFKNNKTSFLNDVEVVLCNKAL
tara:strand:+ start:45137 stop:45280 length:144 start_codon:yes stop_codon:yes gene_type:complete